MNTVKMNTARALCVLALSLSITACGGQSAPLDAAARDDASSGADAGPTPPDLVGRWVSPCVPSPQADGSTQYVLLDFDIAPSRWELDYTAHADEACSTPLATVHIEGPYALLAPSQVVGGAWDATFGFDVKTITPRAEAITGFLNAQEGCGAAEWRTGEPQDVLATGCAAFGQYPSSRCDADHDLVSREGDSLRFGARPADNDMCSADRRPTALSPLALELR